MQWRDLLYFSSGERRALTLLLVLILITFILIILTGHKDRKSSSIVSAAVVTVVDTIRGVITEHNPLPAGNGKLPKGTVIELNGADSLLLKRVPGIGPVYARRIIRYRDILGGYYRLEQLNEVYGIDEEKYGQLSSWFFTDTLLINKMDINELTESQLRKHPYITSRQAGTITRLRKKFPVSGWHELIETGEFTPEDYERLLPYIQFIPE